MKTTLLILIALFLGGKNLHATHLVGGDLTYKYIGTNNGLFEYEITFDIYRDCFNSSTQFDNPIDIGIFKNEPTDKSLYSKESIGPPDESDVNPPSAGSNCAFKPNVCIKRGIYTKRIFLPASNYGYNILWVRCCRNNQINIAQEEGQSYLAFIPPTKVKNNSPKFNSVPSPYICAKDSITLLNAATDADGDSLVYALANPYNGGDKSVPVPSVASTYTAPRNVSYNIGYSYKTPFGITGTADINPRTGLTTVYVPSKGFYSIALDVFEYRNGVLLSKTRRDIELIVIDCKPGPKPYHTKGPNSKAVDTVFDYRVQEGDSINFDLSYAGGDSIRLSGSGELLDNGFANRASFTSVADSNIVTGTFKWKVPCGYARSNAYQFNIYAINNNCPPKYVNNTYTVTVEKFRGSKTIIGPDVVCNNNTVTYNLGNFRAIFRWVASGCTIIGPDTGSVITVKFPDKGTDATLTVYQKNLAKCPGGDTLVKKIKISPPAKGNKLTGNIHPCPNVLTPYQLDSNDATSTFLWIVDSGIISSQNTEKTKSNIIWQKGVKNGKIKVAVTSQSGCVGDTFRLNVMVSNPIIDTLEGPQSVCPNSRGLDYWVKKSVPTSSYKWTAVGGVIKGNPNGRYAQVNWGVKGIGFVKAVEITQYGCIGDTFSIKVNKEYDLKTPPITGDTDVCAFTTNLDYQTKISRGSKYDWKIIGGTINSGNGTYKVNVSWDSAGIALLQVAETAYDSLNNTECRGAIIQLLVNINPIPKTGAITGKSVLCQYDSSIYSVIGFPTSTFKWTVSPLNTLFPNGLSSTTVRFKTEGIASIKVVEITDKGCIGTPSTKQIQVNPVPKAKIISGPNKICLNDNNSKIYSVTNSNNSIFRWTLAGGNINNYDSTSSINVDWLIPGKDSLSVIEVSGEGCNGPENKLIVYYDSFYSEIIRATTLKQNDKIIEIDYKLKNTQFINKGIKLLRKDVTKPDFQFVDSVSIFSDSVIDKRVNTLKNAYTYTISANNLCKNTISSFSHTTILLGGNTPIDDSMIYLNFSKYAGWAKGLKDYEVYFVNNETGKDSLLKQGLDTFLSTIAPLEGNSLCFRVKANKNPITADSGITSLSNKICFEFEPKIYIPNVFSPEGNGINDIFTPSVSNYKSFRMLIFNRWGQKIYETNSTKKGWNGWFKGSICPQDVYLYLIYVEGNKETYFKKGTVTLLR